MLRHTWPLSYMKRRVLGAGPSGPISLVGSATYIQDGQGVTGPTFAFSDLLDGSGNPAPIHNFDFCLISWVTHNAVDLTPSAPSGFGKPVDLYSNDGNDANFAVFDRVLDGSETSVVLPPSGNGQNALSGSVIVFRGVDISSPYDVALVTATGIDTGRPDPGAITPATAGAWIAVLCGSAIGSGGVYTNPGDLTDFKTAFSPDTNPAVSGVGLKKDWTSGAFDPAAWGGANNASFESWAAATIALRSA